MTGVKWPSESPGSAGSLPVEATPRNDHNKIDTRARNGNCGPWATANSRPDRATTLNQRVRSKILKRLPAGIAKLLQGGGTCVVDAEGRDNSWECRPAALLDIGVLQPRIYLFQFCHVRSDIDILPELFSAHWGKNRHDGDGGFLVRHSLRGTLQCPSAPSEADDHGGERAGKSAQQEMREGPVFSD
jgi:hypothetical protein